MLARWAHLIDEPSRWPGLPEAERRAVADELRDVFFVLEERDRDDDLVRLARALADAIEPEATGHAEGAAWQNAAAPLAMLASPDERYEGAARDQLRWLEHLHGVRQVEVDEPLAGRVARWARAQEARPGRGREHGVVRAFARHLAGAVAGGVRRLSPRRRRRRARCRPGWRAGCRGRRGGW